MQYSIPARQMELIGFRLPCYFFVIAMTVMKSPA
jgi:hypothetical protein